MCLFVGQRHVGLCEILPSFSITSINQTLFVHISVDVNTVSLPFSILQVIFCQKFLLRHVMFLPVVSLHGVCVSY